MVKSGMEMLIQTMVTGLLAKLGQEETDRIKAAVNAVFAFEAKIDRMEANQILIMRTLGIPAETDRRQHGDLINGNAEQSQDAGT